MKNSALPKLSLLALLISACSVVVNADRSKVHDDLYTPSTFPDAGETTEDAEETGGASGAAGAADAAGAPAEAGAAGAAGATAAAGAAGS